MQNIPPDAIVITSLGMDSPLGNVVMACAAARAGLAMARELPDVSIPSHDGSEAEVHGHAVPTAVGFQGFGKLVCLAWSALSDLLRQDSIEGTSPARLGLSVCLPDVAARARRRDEGDGAPPRAYGRDLCARLTELSSLRVPHENWSYVERGHAGIGLATAEAAMKLKTGRWERCLVGGADSLLEEPTLKLLIEAGRLKTPDKPDGLAPGEAGAFFLLERFDAASRRGGRILARLEGVATGMERNHLLNGARPQGDGLARVLSQVLASSPVQQSAWIMSDHNGEHHRSAELANVRSRLGREHRWLPGAAVEYPAMSFGDTGAASGAIGVCMAARALAGGYGQGSSALILASSDGEARAALHVERAEKS